jgi:hypothetical protein
MQDRVELQQQAHSRSVLAGLQRASICRNEYIIEANFNLVKHFYI